MQHTMATDADTGPIRAGGAARGRMLIVRLSARKLSRQQAAVESPVLMENDVSLSCDVYQTVTVLSMNGQVLSGFDQVKNSLLEYIILVAEPVGERFSELPDIADV